MRTVTNIFIVNLAVDFPIMLISVFMGVFVYTNKAENRLLLNGNKTPGIRTHTESITSS